MRLLEQNNLHWSRYLGQLLLVTVAIFISIFTVDRWVHVFAIEGKIPGDFRAFLQCMAFFGHGTGCLIAVSLIWFLDRANKQAIPLIIGSVLLAGLITTIVKILVHRPRPFVDLATVSEHITFTEAVFHNFLQSFPSGHTATAFALAMALSLLYSQGKPLFLSFAAIVAMQRVVTQNHFPSDVIAGAVIGVASVKVALACSQIWQKNRASRLSLSPTNARATNSSSGSNVSDRKPNTGRVSTV